MTLVPPSAAPDLPGKSAAKADVPAARRTGQKKRTRDEVEVEEDEVEVEEEEEERIRHNTNLLHVLARKELLDLARLNGDLARNTATNTHVIAASADVAAGDLRYLADGDESDDYGDLYMGPCR